MSDFSCAQGEVCFPLLDCASLLGLLLLVHIETGALLATSRILVIIMRLITIFIRFHDQAFVPLLTTLSLV